MRREADGAGAGGLASGEAPASAGAPSPGALPWVRVAEGAPYFVTEDGAPWTPIGQNDAIHWVELNGLFRRRNLAAVDAHLANLARHGVTCLRLMLEYAHKGHRYIERPVGRPVPAMVQLWDDLFGMCERHGLRILLTPFDTFWMWLRWREHPYNRLHGGPLDHPRRMLLDPGTREAIKARLTFAATRWGGSGTLFAWDLWNEIHPAQAEDTADVFPEFIADLSAHVRELETRLYGRAHPQTVSLFGPELIWKPHLALRDPIFRHPDLDFATIHIYASRTIDAPRNTVDAAVDMGRIVRECLAETPPGRPFLDTEHGPIHQFKDKRRSLPAPFDDEYFLHMAWAHLASGAAGGGMRWPNRKPHVLTPGMRQAQAAMGRFLGLIDWPRFRRVNLNEEIALHDPRGREVTPRKVSRFACADEGQGLVYLLRRDARAPDRRVARDRPPLDLAVTVPGLAGAWRVTPFDTEAGTAGEPFTAGADGGSLTFRVPALAADAAFALRRA